MTNTRRIWFVLIWAGPFQAKLCLSWFVAATFQEFRARGLKGLKQAGFLGVLPSFISSFSSSRHSLCTWHWYFEKKLDQAGFSQPQWGLKHFGTPLGRVTTAYSTDKYKFKISWVRQSTSSFVPYVIWLMLFFCIIIVVAWSITSCIWCCSNIVLTQLETPHTQ